MGLKSNNCNDKVILDAYRLSGVLSAGDKLEYNNEVAEVSKYHEDSDYYSLTCNVNGVFAKALGNIITVTIK